MKINDKVLAAFLVSAGLFSGIQAVQYVASLSAGEKKAMMPIVNLASSDVIAPDGSTVPQNVANNLV